MTNPRKLSLPLKVTVGCLLVIGFIVYVIYRLFLNDSLCMAAGRGDNREIVALLKRGANVNGRGYGYLTPLLRAVEGNHVDTALLLLDQGADIEEANNLNTPLVWAAMEDDPNMVIALLHRGANPNAEENVRLSALQTAEEYKHPQIAEILRRAGAKK